MEQKKTILSGIKPTGILTLGNYLGALKNWALLQHEYNCFYCVADLHALTIRIDPKVLRQNTLEVLAQYIACGLDPANNIIFVQSHVPAHAELSWLLGCYTYIGELNRMTQFKDKSEKQGENINSGLFTYPVLMASDILIYQADLVPVGDDQKQHIELARDIAIRFNNAYETDMFTIPEPFIGQLGARIMGLQFPDRKMSKSEDNDNDYIALRDEPDVIRRKLKRAVTDSDGQVAFKKEKPGVSNLMTIYGVITGKTMPQVEEAFAGLGYGAFKEAVGEAVVETLAPIQARFKELMADKAQLEQIMKDGAQRADAVAQRTLAKAYKKVGLVQKPR